MENEIDVLRGQLYMLVRDGANFQEIYEVSVKLDRLIVTYYREYYHTTDRDRHECAV